MSTIIKDTFVVNVATRGGFTNLYQSIFSLLLTTPPWVRAQGPVHKQTMIGERAGEGVVKQKPVSK